MQIEDRAILSTWVQYLRSLTMSRGLTSPSLKYDPDAFFVVTEINENLYNSVFLHHPTDNSKLIQELVAIQKDLKLPLTAWITSNTNLPQLEQTLTGHFESPGAFYGMLLDLNNVSMTVCSPKISIEQVKNQKQANEFAQVFSQTFNFPNLLERKAIWAKNQYESLSPSGLSYIAKVDGVVAGICSLMLDETFSDFRVGGLYNACVLPEFRNLGIGTAMACHRVKVAKERGLEYLSILLMSDAMARGYCERLGFKNYQPLIPYCIR